MNNYKTKLAKLSNRYNPDKSVLVEQRMFSSIQKYDKDVSKYVMQSMKAVDEVYTQRTKEAGEKVKQHLQNVLCDVSYRYQGSVMTDTHIKGASDIDLLVLCDNFYGTDIFKVREELQNLWKYNNTEINNLRDYDESFSRYQGDGNQDLANLRHQIEQVMDNTYIECDITKPKSVKITNQSLHRDVDIVTSMWFQSFEYVLEGMPEEKLGIKIFNKERGYAEGPDYPFLSIKRINERSTYTNGRLKRMIRFLKNVRSDSDSNIPLTSFEINAICYSIPPAEYKHLEYRDLVFLLWNTMYNMVACEEYNKLKSVVGDEYVFLRKPDKIEALKALEDEVFSIHKDLTA